MANYNVHAPFILGNEWVPIRNANYASDGVTERGYQFQLQTAVTPVSGAFYVSESPENQLAQACDLVAVYPAGRETLTGPVRKVKIKPSAITVTNIGSGSIDASEGVAALLNSEDGKFIVFLADTGSLEQLQVSFDTEPHAAVLLGKRILDVRLRYSLNSPNVANGNDMTFRIHNQNAFKGVIFPDVTEITNSSDVGKISVLSLTELNPTWDMTANFRGQRTVLPWRFQELNRFRASEPAATALTIFLQNDATIAAVLLGFMELEVVFCEETRVLYGGFRTYDSNFVNFPVLLEEDYNLGAVAVYLFNPATHTQGNTLQPGSYVVTVYHRDMASRSVRQGTPKIHAVRPFYNLSTVLPIRVNQTTTEDDQFSLGIEDVVTHITLHTASTIVTGVHAYGTRYGAPVYGTLTATQEIEDDVSNGGQYAQVRFYARRFGNTTTPLSLQTTGGLNTVSISVAAFDALEEIVDGWREVNLRFTTPVTISPTAGTSDWRWLATGELPGNQWQVLVASGPTGSWGPNAAAASTGPATYWEPRGSTVNLTWQSPTVTGAVSDSISDAVLFFSQDPPAVTGFALSVQRQPLSVALQCSSPQGCIPTGLAYANLTWDMGVICDTFSTPVTGGWDSTETGQSWVIASGTPGLFGKTGEVGQITHIAVNTSNIIFVSSATLRNVVVTATFIPPVVAATDDFRCEVVARRIDIGNYYAARVRFEASNVLGFDIFKVVGAAFTTLASVTVPNFTYSTGVPVRLSLTVVDSNLTARMWLADHPEFNQQLTIIDTSHSAAGHVAVQSFLTGGNTNTLPLTIGVDDFTAVPADLVDGSYEVQRFDAIDGQWRTILNTTNLCVNSLSDFEARVGIESQYRIRTLNALDFAGPWVTGSATIPAPGVDILGDANSVLIFTSNEDSSASLAYVMQWEGQPVETFTFPEADAVTLQRLFGRDYFIALRPLERGGERFERVILVNAAAISLPSLPNFNDIRDLAWADLNYVCVRDELGNRWFATIIVPDGSVRLNRTAYLAKITVVKVTDTPTPLNPGS